MLQTTQWLSVLIELCNTSLYQFSLGPCAPTNNSLSPRKCLPDLKPSQFLGLSSPNHSLLTYQAEQILLQAPSFQQFSRKRDSWFMQVDLNNTFGMLWWGCRKSTQHRAVPPAPSKLQLHFKGVAWYLQLIWTEIQIGKTTPGEQPPLFRSSPASLWPHS